ncbi:MAG: hypothetical protein FWC40_06800, partial [Proteobacteria bacterium]|nr:hypothetical protein [Pseudomonadota bacterium]
GTASCRGGGVSRCEDSGDGCTAWGVPSACSTGTACADGVCQPSCSVVCAVGSKSCQDGAVVSCETNASGCQMWGSKTYCPPGYYCSGGTCVEAYSCDDACSLSQRTCDGNYAMYCRHDYATGCNQWNVSEYCSDRCAGGYCESTCTDKCLAGETSCDGNRVMACRLGSNGCTDWYVSRTCASSEVCSMGECRPPCAGAVCTIGETQCEGERVVTCVADAGTGCPKWGSAVNCAGSQYECREKQCRLKCQYMVTPCSEAEVGTRRCASGNETWRCFMCPYQFCPIYRVESCGDRLCSEGVCK